MVNSVFIQKTTVSKCADIMNSTNRVLYVFNEAGFFLSHRLPVARAAVSEGYEVHVAVPNGKDVERIRNEGFFCHLIPLNRRGSHLWQELKTVLALFRLYKSLKPNLVEHATIKPVIYGNTAARLARVKCVVNWMTGLGYVFISTSTKGALLRKAVLFAYKLVLGHPNKRVIFENPDDRASFISKKIVKLDATVLIKGAGVDTKEFFQSPEETGTPFVVLASRMLWDKGVAEFVDAARSLREASVKARFVLVGDSDPGNPASVSRKQLEEWNKSGVVEWWGRRNDIPNIFAKSHIVCLPSYREGLPKVLIEAAACARPIVTTDTPGCREIVKHGENGLLVPVRDAAALARALRKLIEDPFLRKRMGEKGRALAVADFSVEQVVNETITVYKELLA